MGLGLAVAEAVTEPARGPELERARGAELERARGPAEPRARGGGSDLQMAVPGLVPVPAEAAWAVENPSPAAVDPSSAAAVPPPPRSCAEARPGRCSEAGRPGRRCRGATRQPARAGRGQEDAPPSCDRGVRGCRGPCPGNPSCDASPRRSKDRPPRDSEGRHCRGCRPRAAPTSTSFCRCRRDRPCPAP